MIGACDYTIPTFRSTVASELAFLAVRMERLGSKAVQLFVHHRDQAVRLGIKALQAVSDDR
jgi:hypothetical protein